MDKPALYTSANGLSRRDASDFSDEFADGIGQMSGRCLDIGSGPGDVVVDFVLPKLNPTASLVCSDISEKMVNFGNKEYKENNRLSFIMLNIESPNLPENLIAQFDHVTSYYCVHWCQDMRQVFDNIFNLLRPGGTALVTFIADTPIFDAYESLVTMPRYQPYMKDMARFIPVFQHIVERRCETLEALLRLVGFEIEHCSVRRRRYPFASSDDLSDFLMSLKPFTERMPPGLREEYREDLVDEVTRRSTLFKKNNKNANEHSILLTYHAFVVYFSKPGAK